MAFNVPFHDFQRFEDFRKSFNKVMIDLDVFIESMQDLKTMRPTEISEILQRRSRTSIEMQNIVKIILKNGKKIGLSFTTDNSYVDNLINMC